MYPIMEGKHMFEIKLTEEQAKEMEQFVENHMSGCYMSLYDEEDVPEDFETYGAYCGCQTCDTREYLMSAFDWLRSRQILDLHVE